MADLQVGKSELSPFISLATFWLKVITVCLDLGGQRVKQVVAHTSHRPVLTSQQPRALAFVLVPNRGSRDTAECPVKGVSGLG